MKLDPAHAEAEKAAAARRAAFRPRAEAGARGSRRRPGARRSRPAPGRRPPSPRPAGLEQKGEQALAVRPDRSPPPAASSRRAAASSGPAARPSRAPPSADPAEPCRSSAWYDSATDFVAGTGAREELRGLPGGLRSVMNLDRIGKYRVVGTIGKGAMGEVYKAHDPLLNRYVAIKTIAPALAADPDFRQRFQREAQSAAQLNHPNIVTVYDFGEEDGLTYMAMELLEGVDLKRGDPRARARHLGRKLEVMEQICDGLAFAHAKGVVHRDLKPGNIHLQPNGQVKILDFGLARLGASDMTKTGTVMGTPHYMSPEQVRGQKADARSDVFSLGAVFYELLSHHRPFEADSVHGVLFQILEQEPEPIRKWAPEVPAAARRRRRAGARQGPRPPLRRRRRDGARARRAREAIAGETLVEDAGAGRGHDVPGRRRDRRRALARPPRSGARPPSTLARTPARAAQSHLPRTVRPDPTVGGGPATQVPGGAGPARALAPRRRRGSSCSPARWAASCGFAGGRRRQAHGRRPARSRAA